MRMQGMACKWDFFSLFPAYAGVIPGDDQGHRGAMTFPRVCGGDPYHFRYKNSEFLFSPRMRG